MGAVHAPAGAVCTCHDNTYLYDECLALRGDKYTQRLPYICLTFPPGLPVCKANVYFSMINLYGSHGKIDIAGYMYLSVTKVAIFF